MSKSNSESLIYFGTTDPGSVNPYKIGRAPTLDNAAQVGASLIRPPVGAPLFVGIMDGVYFSLPISQVVNLLSVERANPTHLYRFIVDLAYALQDDPDFHKVLRDGMEPSAIQAEIPTLIGVCGAILNELSARHIGRQWSEEPGEALLEWQAWATGELMDFIKSKPQLIAGYYQACERMSRAMGLIKGNGDPAFVTFTALGAYAVDQYEPKIKLRKL